MSKNIPIVEHILSANDQIADQNLATLKAAGVFAINIMASPGAGKTSTILKTFELLENRIKMGVIEGDLARQAPDPGGRSRSVLRPDRSRSRRIG